MESNQAVQNEEKIIHRFRPYTLHEPHPLFNGRVYARTLVPWDGSYCYSADSLLFEPDPELGTALKYARKLHLSGINQKRASKAAISFLTKKGGQPPRGNGLKGGK